MRNFTGITKEFAVSGDLLAAGSWNRDMVRLGFT